MSPGGEICLVTAEEYRGGVVGTIFDSGDGERSVTWRRWSTIIDVIVSALRKEVVRPELKIVVRRRLLCPAEKSQKMAIQLVRPRTD